MTNRNWRALSEGKTVTSPGGCHPGIIETHVSLVRVPKGWRTHEYSYGRDGWTIRCEEYEIKTEFWTHNKPSISWRRTIEKTAVAVTMLEKWTWGAFSAREAPGGGWTIHPADDLSSIKGSFPKEIAIGAR
jgi:hypothetical protein